MEQDVNNESEKDIPTRKKKKLLVAGIVLSAVVVFAAVFFALIWIGIIPIAGLSQEQQGMNQTENSEDADSTDEAEESEDETDLTADEVKVYDLYDLTETFSNGLDTASYKNLGILETETNVAIKLRVTVNYTNAEYIFGIAKEETEHPWTKSGYFIEVCPEKKTIEIKTGKTTTVAKLTDLVISDEYVIEYGVVNMRDETNEVAARKVYVKMDGAEVLSYLDKDLDRAIGTYAPIYAGAGSSLIFQTCAYEFKGEAPLVQDIKTILGGVSAKELNPGLSYLGELVQGTNVAVRARVYIQNYHVAQGFVTNIHSTGFKIGFSRVNKEGFWREPGSGYQIWVRPQWVDIGCDIETTGCARRDYEVPQDFVLEVGSYDIDLWKNGELIQENYARKVYVKVDGEEILSWLDYEENRLFGQHVLFYAEGQVKITLISAGD